MNKDDMIRMAREAGWQYAEGDDGYKPLWRFADLVAAAEREACAEIAYAHALQHYSIPSSIARAVRERGQNDLSQQYPRSGAIPKYDKKGI